MPFTAACSAYVDTICKDVKQIIFSHFFILVLGGTTKHLMTGPFWNSEFVFPSKLNVPLGFTLRNFQGHKGTKLTCTVSLEPVIKSSIMSVICCRRDMWVVKKRARISCSQSSLTGRVMWSQSEAASSAPAQSLKWHCTQCVFLLGKEKKFMLSLTIMMSLSKRITWGSTLEAVFHNVPELARLFSIQMEFEFNFINVF